MKHQKMPASMYRFFWSFLNSPCSNFETWKASLLLINSFTIFRLEGSECLSGFPLFSNVAAMDSGGFYKHNKWGNFDWSITSGIKTTFINRFSIHLASIESIFFCIIIPLSQTYECSLLYQIVHPYNSALNLV